MRYLILILFLGLLGPVYSQTTGDVVLGISKTGTTTSKPLILTPQLNGIPIFTGNSSDALAQLIFPSQSGQAGKVLGTTGSVLTWTTPTLGNLSGDVTSTGSVTTLSTVNSSVGSFGSSTAIPAFTVDAKGRITAATTSTITPAWSNITGKSLVNADVASNAAIAITKLAPLPVYPAFALSDETTALTTGLKLTYRMPYAMTVTGVYVESVTAPTGSTIIADVKKNGTTIFSTKPSIDASEDDSATGAVQAVLTGGTTSLALRDKLTFSIDQVGSTIAGAGLKVTLVGTRVP